MPVQPSYLAPLPSPSDNVVLEAMRMNAEITRTMVDRFPMMMEAAASLIRAADGAGLPSRAPRVIEVSDGGEQDDDDEASATPPGFDLNALVAQLVPMLVTSLMSGKAKAPSLASMLDWRKATPSAAPVAREPGELAPSTARTATKTATAPSAVPIALDPAAMAHVIAVQAALMPHEVTFVQEVAKELSPAGLRTWFDELAKLSVPDAVARVRTLIAGNAAKDGAS